VAPSRRTGRSTDPRARALAAALFVALAIAACRKSAPEVVVPVGEGRFLLGVFEGTLPCRNCDGVRTHLTLWSSGPDDFTRPTYSLVETYIGTQMGLQRFRAEGPWTLVRGGATDPEVTIYQLEPDKPTMQRSFRVLDSQRIALLGRDLRTLEPVDDYTLTRVESPPADQSEP